MHFNRSILKQHEEERHDERYALTEHSFAQEPTYKLCYKTTEIIRCTRSNVLLSVVLKSSTLSAFFSSLIWCVKDPPRMKDELCTI